MAALRGRPFGFLASVSARVPADLDRRYGFELCFGVGTGSKGVKARYIWPQTAEQQGVSSESTADAAGSGRGTTQPPEVTDDQLREEVHRFLTELGPKTRVAAVPPDITRFHSRAGRITELVWEHYGSALTDVVPAIGTHVPLSQEEREHMYPGVPSELFRVHDWRTEVDTLGTVPGEKVAEITGGIADFRWPAEISRRLSRGGHDLILSIGQVVPHEVIGMANYNKNLFVGTGGYECISKSHYISALYGIEQVLGRANNPVRSLMNYAEREFARDLPIVYIMTVVGTRPDGSTYTRGLFMGDEPDCFELAARCSLETNVTLLDEPAEKVVVYLDPEEFKSTWLGDKAVYRTRLAIQEGGELVILAPGLRQFGEDDEIDRLIRRFGYVGRDNVLEAVRSDPELQGSLATAAHLIHGSSEGRFSVTYCPGHVTREEIEGVGYQYADLDEMMRRYDPQALQPGMNTLGDGERVYFVANPALGLWAERSRFR